MINKIFQPLGNDYLIHFLDDGLIFSDNFQQHIKQLRSVLTILQNNGLILQLKNVSLQNKKLTS